MTRSTSSLPCPSLWFLFTVHGALSAPDGNLHMELSSYRCSPAGVGSLQHSDPYVYIRSWPQHCAQLREHKRSPKISTVFTLYEAGRAREALAKIFFFPENHTQGFTELYVQTCASRVAGHVFPLQLFKSNSVNGLSREHSLPHCWKRHSCKPSFRRRKWRWEKWKLSQNVLKAFTFR